MLCTRITGRCSGWARDGELPGVCDGLAATYAERAFPYGWHCSSTAPAPSVWDHYPWRYGYGGSRWRGTAITSELQTKNK